MRLKPEFKGALLALLGVALVLVGIWISIGLRLRIWSHHDYQLYLGITRSVDVGHALWWGEIKTGNDVEKIITDWNPHRITRFGRWVEVTWFPGGPPRKDGLSFVGVTMLAKDGHLVQASFFSDGTDGRIFFNTLTRADASECNVAYKAYADGRRKAATTL